MSSMIFYIDLAFSEPHVALASLLAGIVFGAATILLRATKGSKIQSFSPPCEQEIEQAERTNRAKGHENAGSLSKRAAFSPLVLPRTSLPPYYAPWDQAAASLPHLIRDETLRATLDRLPVLDACSNEKLPDQHLQRAATVLGILAHAYVRLEGTVSLTAKYDSHAEVLPKALHLPWTQICQRLGRANPDASLSYIDLVVHNFTTSHGSCMDLTLETSGLLIPTVNNQEEKTFYGTMIEISSKTVPILHQVIEAQKAVLMEDATALEASLQAMLPLLSAITASLHKISMKEGSKSYVDPVIWTQTVANLAIPWLKGVTGAAGTAHPLFHMMDVFFGRKTYESKIGKEAITVRSTYPVHWQRFLDALGQVSVRNFIDHLKSKRKTELSAVWATLESDYGGDWGLLGIHRRKVYGFLSVSFRIGRNSTINGLGHGTQRAKWTEADRELEKARRDRRAVDLPKRSVCSGTQSREVYYFSDIIHQNTATRGYWFTSGDYVYDASSFMSKHPGGRTVIALCGGQDATADLSAVGHLADPKIRAVLDRFCIGEIRRIIFASPKLQLLYDEAVLLAQKITETENICRTTLTFLQAKMTVLDRPNELTPQKRRHLRRTKDRIRDEHAKTLASQAGAVLALFEGTANNSNPGKSCEALAKVGTEVFVRADEASLRNCDEALGWFEGDFQGLGAMNRIAADTLKRLESLPFDTERLDTCSADGVREGLAVIAQEILRLGQ